jgi:hypothetical protein
MTLMLWAAIGLTSGAAVLHAVLGLRRPRNRAYLAFAGMMTFLTLYLYFGERLHRATTADEVVEAMRLQFVAILACHGCLLVFVPTYTRVRIPRGVMGLYWAGLAILFFFNLGAPSGLWFSGPPELVRVGFAGGSYNAVVAPPMSLPQYAYAAYYMSFLVVALGCAAREYRRGERQRSVAFGAAIVILLVHTVIDVVRDTVGGTWPYVAELGFVTWAIIMSVQLAHDFRAQSDALRLTLADVEAQADQLAAMLGAMRALERNMHAPLERLETGLVTLTAATAKEQDHLTRLRRAVARLRALALSMQDDCALRGPLHDVSTGCPPR